MFPGYLPGWIYDQGVVDTSLPFAELQKRSHVNERGQAADKDPNFSLRIREGLPPHAVRKRAALILGNESHGLPDALLTETDEQWSIPGNGKIDSLSLPQAAAIMMYECVKK
mgnify:CR=1 FL=1